MERFRKCILFLFLMSSVSSVDRNNFKTCEQSSFCRRLRNMKQDSSQYKIDLKTLLVSEHSVEAELSNNEGKFKLTLSSLLDNTFRIFVDEINPLHPRYKVEGALYKEPDAFPLEVLEKTDDQITIKSHDKKVVIYTSPLKIEFYNSNDKVVAVINSRGLFEIEHLRQKPTAKEENVEVADQIPKEDPGAWEENFKSHQDSKPRGPEAVGTDIKFPGAHRAYGIPEHADQLSLRSTGPGGTEPYRLYNLDVFEYELDSTMALYGAVPMLYAHSPEGTVGVFWHNAAETWVDVSNSKDVNGVSSFLANLVSDKDKSQVDVHFMSESGVFDLFVFLGPSPKDVARQYVALTGVAPLPQLFAIAYHQCRWNYNDEDDVKGVIENFDEHDLPVDAIWLDIEYTDAKKYFTWDPIKFKHPEIMVNNLTSTGRKLIVIIDPHIKRESGYFFHEDCLANDYYVKSKDGKVYEGWCWPGSSSYSDVFNPSFREYYVNSYSLDNFKGTTNDVYLWNDMNEPSVFNGPEITMPKDCVHYGGWEHRHVHNIYGLFFTIGTFEGLLKRSGHKLRPFILTRAHFAGSQRYTAMWTGDNMASWSHLKISFPMCLSEALAGISFCGADVGGFFNNPDVELLQRWYQAGIWLPFFRSHAHIDTKRREPYLFNQDIRNRIRTALRLRYAHLPLWYTLFYEHETTAEPVIRPLFYHYPNDVKTYDIDNELLIGNSLLARPVTEAGASSVSIYLPGDDSEVWYDIEDFKGYSGGNNFNMPVTLDKIPAFYRGGSIIPRKDRPRRSSVLMLEDPYTLYIALDKTNSANGTLYIDDGQSYDYRNKKFIYTTFTFKDGKLKNEHLKDTDYATKAWIEKVVIINPPVGITKAILKGKDAGEVELKVLYEKEDRALVIRKPGVSVRDTFTIELKN